MGNKQTEKKKRQKKNRQWRKQQAEIELRRYHLRHSQRRLLERYELLLTELEVREVETNIRGGFCTVLDYNPHRKVWHVFVPWNGNAIRAVWSAEKNCLVTVLPWGGN